MEWIRLDLIKIAHESATAKWLPSLRSPFESFLARRLAFRPEGDVDMETSIFRGAEGHFRAGDMVRKSNCGENNRFFAIEAEPARFC